MVTSLKSPPKIVSTYSAAKINKVIIFLLPKELLSIYSIDYTVDT